ncbi:MAG: MFS transporter [Solirubrobacteraceae bacterium]
MKQDAVDTNRRWLGLAALSLAQLVIAIDVSVIVLALPTIQTDLRMSTATGQWVLTAYTAPFAAVLLLGGRIADYWGRKRTFLLGLITLMAASTLGGLAGSTAILLAARAMQGASAALLVPASLSLLNVMFTEPKERARALAAYNATTLAGVALGLVIGGVLAQYLSWHWCLLVNLPFCALALASGIPFLVESRVAGRPRYDVPGAILGSLSLGTLVYGFAHGGTNGFGNPVTVAALLAAVVLAAAFVWVESKVERPMLPLRLLANPNRSGALIANLCLFTALIGVWLFITYYLQSVQGHGAAVTGLMMFPYAAGAVAFAAVMEQPLGRMPRRIPIALGLVGATVVDVWFGFLSPGWGYAARVLPAIVFLGACIVTTMIAVSAAVLDDTPEDDSGICSALLTVAQQIGMAVGASLLTTIAVRATDHAARGHVPTAADLVQGYNAGSFAAAGFDLAGLAAAIVLIGAWARQRTAPSRSPRTTRNNSQAEASTD